MSTEDKNRITRLIRTAEQGNDKASKQAMKELKKIDSTYHWCNEWDGMVICSSDPEIENCLCNKK